MTIRLFLLQLALLVLPAVTALADQTYLCTYGQQERVISVIYADQQTRLPCEVRYQKEGVTEVLWSAEEQTGFCEAKARDFVAQQIAWGWRCSDFSTSMPSAQGYTPEQVADYRRAAHFAQALAAMSPFRVLIMEYYAMQGDYPSSLQELGYEREQMQDSAAISDLSVDEQGAIYALGNRELGEQVVIRLAPAQTLGGLSTEWRCSTNVDLNGGVRCTYDEELEFPDSW